jgi:hypothetical protein
MMSAQHLLLLERLAELQELFTALQYRIGPTDTDSIERMQVVAKRASEIIEEWPDEYWPLESESADNLWPNKPEAIQFFKLGLEKIAAYKNRPASSFDFSAWMAIRLDIYTGLYFFSNPKEDDM